MNKIIYSLLYVDDVTKSVAFYEKLLSRLPHEVFPTFASFRLNDGMLLGLWSISTATPDVTPPGGCELGLVVASAADVEHTFETWRQQGVTILQEPADLVFGRTFLAADPDGHRIRVFNEADPA